MKKRCRLRTNDPIRLEKKRLARLNELKAKMAEMQRKKEEQQEENRKRKREEEEQDVATEGDTIDGGGATTDPVVVQAEADDEDGDDGIKKEEEEDEDEDDNLSGPKTELNEETNLLESSLDTVNEKTKEEAESDRQKLLAGELIGEGVKTRRKVTTKTCSMPEMMRDQIFTTRVPRRRSPLRHRNSNSSNNNRPSMALAVRMMEFLVPPTLPRRMVQQQQQQVVHPRRTNDLLF